MWQKWRPARGEDPSDRRFEPFMGVRDHQFDATQASPRQAVQKARPEGLGFRPADLPPDNFAPPVKPVS